MRTVSKVKAKPEPEDSAPHHLSEHQGADCEVEMNKSENGLRSQQTKRGEISEGREKMPSADELNFVRAQVIWTKVNCGSQPQTRSTAWSHTRTATGETKNSSVIRVFTGTSKQLSSHKAKCKVIAWLLSQPGAWVETSLKSAQGITRDNHYLQASWQVRFPWNKWIGNKIKESPDSQKLYLGSTGLLGDILF